MTSFQNTFTDLGDFNTKVLSDDFVFANLETLQIKGQTANNGNFNYKAKTVWDSKNNRFNTKNEFQADFPLCNKYFLWYGIRNAGEIKVHLDGGNTKINNKDINIFANVKSVNPEKTRFHVRLGANYWGSKCTSNSRLEFDSGNLQNLGFSHRNLLRHGNYLFGFVTSIGLTDLSVNRTDAVIGHECDQASIYLSHVAGEKPGNGILGQLVLDAVYKHNKNNSFAIQATDDFTADKVGFLVGHSSQINDEITIRHRIDNNLKFAGAFKYKVNNLFTLTASALLDFQAETLFNTQSILPVPLGFQLEFNI